MTSVLLSRSMDTIIVAGFSFVVTIARELEAPGAYVAGSILVEDTGDPLLNSEIAIAVAKAIVAKRGTIA